MLNERDVSPDRAVLAGHFAWNEVDYATVFDASGTAYYVVYWYRDEEISGHELGRFEDWCVLESGERPAWMDDETMRSEREFQRAVREVVELR